MKRVIQHLHFVGIGGAGMSAIAEVLKAQGYRISGSDEVESKVTRRLATLGIPVFIGHAAAHIGSAQALVTSTAVAADNPEVLAARERHLPVVARAVVLAELLRRQQGIAITGTHGKTTTTALVASVLLEAGADPSFVIGGELISAGANARLGGGDFIVVEADESDASFLHLSPVIGVVTNIDADHLETYGQDLGRLHAAFVEFLHRLPFYGRAIVCSDDPGVRAVLPRLARPLLTYGLGDDAEVRGVQLQARPGGQMQFIAQRRTSGSPVTALPDLAVTLNQAGTHNVLNALAAIAVAMELRLPDAAVTRALTQFAGVGRRFERHGELPSRDGGCFSLVDDYGHHPVEMAAVLQAARAAFPGRRLLVAFQPHRYSRTRDCFADFVQVLSQFDAVLLTEVYAASEMPIAAADGHALWQALAAAVVQQPGAAAAPLWVPQVEALAAAIAANARGGDVIITLGAGTIGAVPQQLLKLLAMAGGRA